MAEVIPVRVLSAVNSEVVLTRLTCDGMPPTGVKMTLELCVSVVIAFDAERRSLLPS